MFHQNPYTVETVWLIIKNIHTISDFTKCCYIVMISHVSSKPNWYWAHAVCNQSFIFFWNCYYFSDLETQWPRNPKLKEIWPFIDQLSEGVCHNIEELSIFDLQKSLSSVSELVFPFPPQKYDAALMPTFDKLHFCNVHGRVTLANEIWDAGE